MSLHFTPHACECCLWLPRFQMYMCVLPNSGQEVLVWVVIYSPITPLLCTCQGGGGGRMYCNIHQLVWETNGVCLPQNTQTIWRDIVTIAIGPPWGLTCTNTHTHNKALVLPDLPHAWGMCNSCTRQMNMSALYHHKKLWPSMRTQSAIMYNIITTIVFLIN